MSEGDSKVAPTSSGIASRLYYSSLTPPPPPPSTFPPSPPSPVVADCTQNTQRSHWMALLGAALGVGCVIGPIIGGQTAEIVGDAAPAVIATCIFVLLGPVVAHVLPETCAGACRV